MARAAERLDENVAGDFFVDASCIDCDLCRQLAPRTFARSSRHDQSIVIAQPASLADEERALVALVTCPTASIGALGKHDVKRASALLPEPRGGGVYFVGYASPDSYGASSWLYTRPGGNVLIDSPRAARPLLDRIDALGGVRWLVLTHRDDVADHAVLARRFGCERVMHRADVSSGTRAVERIIDGDGDAPIALDRDLTIVPVPGHTRGSIALHAGDALFTGDHLAGDDDGELHAWRSVCWYSWAEQTRSVARLASLEFRRVFPGHGRPFETRDASEMREALARLVARMQR